MIGERESWLGCIARRPKLVAVRSLLSLWSPGRLHFCANWQSEEH